MSVPGMNDPRLNDPQKQSRPLPQRWVIILGAGMVTGVLLTFLANVEVGVSIGLAVVGTLHAIME